MRSLWRRLNIIDKPNQRSSHTKVVLRGGDIIFLIGTWVWNAFFGFLYPWALAAGISFVDDIHSLPDSERLVAQLTPFGAFLPSHLGNAQASLTLLSVWRQFVAMGLLIVQLYLSARSGEMFANSSVLGLALMAVAALVVCVGATNIYNFMDGINGITAGYSLSVLVPLILMNSKNPFMENSFLVVVALSVLVFSVFNFRPKNKAKCFAGDVGSVGIAFILLFSIGMLIVRTGDVTWLVFLLVYGVDGCLTICHRIMLHENLGEAHRKHCFQLMSNELGMSHVAVTLIYMSIQLVISLVMVYLVPDSFAAHLIYLVACFVVLAAGYVAFMKKYYHLHEEYLASLK